MLKANTAYAYLGAVGPALADFIPSDPPPPDSPSAGGGSPFTALWKQIFALVGGDGTAADPGMLSIISTFRDFLAKIVPAADNEDLGALKDLQDSGELDRVTDMANLLKTLVDGFTPKVLTIGAAITAGMRPAIDVDPGIAVPNPVAWTAREWLFWKHPGRFAAALCRKAKTSGDPRMIAYGVGYLCSYAGHAAGNSFINSSVGGTYRTQWWRKRWVDNYVDAWVYGFYASGVTMSGDTPSKPYDQWASLCNANLQQKIEVAGPLDPIDIMARLRDGQPFPGVLPADFADFWMDAWHEAYGTGLSRFNAGALNGAYVMTWMMLWFQTANAVIGCNPAPPATPPAGCDDTQPSWVDPFTAAPGDNGTGQTPPSPTFDHDPNTAEVVTGAILALLGVVACIFGGAAVGIPAIVGGIGLIVDGELQFTWQQLRCDLYWYRQYLYNGLDVLHNLVTLGGFTPPYAAELAEDQTVMSLLGSPYKFDSGKRVVKSQLRFPAPPGLLERASEFPSKPWGGTLGTWPNAPTANDPGWEQPLTAASYAIAYPDFFIDSDTANPLTATNNLWTGGTWPPGFRIDPATDRPVQFGNAVANLVEMVRRAGDPLPDWNLDADRGTGALTWQFANGTYTDPTAVEAEPL